MTVFSSIPPPDRCAAISLRSTNLNLIPILQALLREKSVSRAANALGLSQPATSAALSRLRALLDDPLLVQVGRSMHPTARAREITPALERLCSALEDFLADLPFDPAQAERVFVVAAPDYLAMLLGQGLLETFSTQAPGVRVRFIDVPDMVPERLASGSIDAAVCADVSIWPGLMRRGGFADRMVGVVARDHPLLGHAKPTPAQIRAYPQLTFLLNTPPGGRRAPLPVLPGVLEDAQLASQQFLVLPFLAVRSHCVARVPKSLADRFSTVLPLGQIDLGEEGAEIDTCVFWSSVQEGDTAHQWFRAQLAETLAATFGAGAEAA